MTKPMNFSQSFAKWTIDAEQRTIQRRDGLSLRFHYRSLTPRNSAVSIGGNPLWFSRVKGCMRYADIVSPYGAARLPRW